MIMKGALVLSLVTAAHGFVPSTLKRPAAAAPLNVGSSSSGAGLECMNRVKDPDARPALVGMYGVGEETGNEPWDPLGLSTIHDLISKSEHANNFPHVKFMREAELKHGRIAMLAFVGVCVQKGLNFHWPGDLGGLYYDASAPWYSAPTSAFATNPVGMAQIVLFIGLIEGQYDSGPFWFGNGDREPGDYGWAKYAKLEGPALLRKQKAEIKNGRLAMIAVMGFVSAHYLPGSVPFLNNLGF